MSEIMDWYEATVHGASVNAVAAKSGVVQTTLDRQIKKGALSPEVIVAVARAYGTDVLDALVCADVITRDDIRKHGVRAALDRATDREIADEVRRRLEGGESAALDAPLT